MNAPNPIPANSQSKPGRARVWYAFVGLLFLSALLFRFHFMSTVVAGASMRPTLETGDWLLVDKRAYRTEEPRRGDLVVARVRNELIVKRVVALPGETVRVEHGKLFINDQEFAEKQSTLQGGLEIGSGKLFRGKFAILGDNRSQSVSTSVYALVSKDQIVGKVVNRLHWGRANVS